MCKNPCKTRRLFRVRHPPPKDKQWIKLKLDKLESTAEMWCFFNCRKEIRWRR